MYQFEILQTIESNKWDSFLDDFPKSTQHTAQVTFIQSSLWKTFQESVGRNTMAFTIKKEDNLVGVGLGVEIKAKRGKYLYFRNGPVLDWSNKELVAQTIEFLQKEAKKRSLWAMRISPLVENNSQAAKIIESFKFPLNPMNDVEALDTWLVDLRGKNEEQLMSELKKKTRYEVKKALKNSTFEVTNDVGKVKYFYSIMQDTVARNNWNAYSQDYIAKEFEAFAKADNASLILAKHTDEYIAGAMFIHFAGQTTYHYAASSSAHRALSAPYGIVWTAMLEALKRNHDHFSFWGITPKNAKPTHPWSGLTQFKMKFTGFEQRWLASRDIPVSPLYWLTNGYERIDKKRKGY